MVNYCFVLPYIQGELELAKKFAQENTITKEHDEFYKLAGITREDVWIQHSPSESGAPDLEVISIETHSPYQYVQRICYIKSSTGYKVL
ncbi:MAG TPA: hypothetical protein VKA91_01225 [Nitrososphaeraceae archaeon]|nr:hypothetical protein [Nitrososphaeraceae archaeon]